MNLGHERHSKDEYSDIWLTPKHIIEAIGLLDNDYCANSVRPFPTALNHHTEKQGNGLEINWKNKVFCNAPYSNIEGWTKKMSEHNNGISLLFARVDTKYFHKYIWKKATSIYFIKGRLKFVKPDGSINSTAGAPSVLVAYGDECDTILKNIDKTVLDGYYVKLNN